jgi:hypothetical protein
MAVKKYGHLIKKLVYNRLLGGMEDPCIRECCYSPLLLARTESGPSPLKKFSPSVLKGGG